MQLKLVVGDVSEWRDESSIRYCDLNADLYSEIAKWWRAYDIEPMPMAAFPEKVIVVYHGQEMAAVCHPYFCNANAAWIAFTIASPEIKGRARLTAIKLAVKSAAEAAQRHVGDDGFIWSMTDNLMLQKLYVKHCGFKPSGIPGNFVIAGKDVPTGMLI